MRGIAIAALFLTPLVSMAQIIHVLDNETKEPIEFAEIYSFSPQAYATTNSNGEAEMSEFVNADTIEIRNLGYKTFVTSYSRLQASGFEVRLEPSAFDIEEVTIAATRWRQSSGNVPVKIASISAKEVALQNPQTAADLLGISGKVYIQKSQQGGGSPMIRGFATNRLLYTVDGVRANSAIFRGGNIQNVINFDPFAIENTEVVFGPGSVIYGSDAIGGIMSFQTLTPEFSRSDKPLISGKAVARYSSINNERTGHFDINVGWKKWAMVSSFSSWNYDHLKQGSNGPDDYIKPYFVERIDSTDVVVDQEDPLLQIPSAYNQVNLMQKLRFRPNDQWDFTYAFHFSETTPYGRYDRHNRVRNGRPRYGQWDYGPQSWMMNNLTISHTGSNAVYDDLAIRVAQQTFRESRISRDFNKAEQADQQEKVLAYSFNIDFLKTSGSHTITYGAEYVLNDVSSNGQLTDINSALKMPGPSRYPASNWSSIGAFITDDITVSDNLSVQAGLRYNHFILNSDFDTTFYDFPFTEANINNGALTGNLGAVFRPGNSWVFKANFGTAFRAPNVDDVGKVFDSEPGAVTVPNPDLEAEYAYSFDLDFAKVFGDIVKIDVSGYYTILNNAMVRRASTINGQDSIIYEGELSQVQAIQNAAVANVYGLQGGLEVKLPAGFRIQSDINWQVGEEELDDGSTSPSRHAAPLFGVTRLMYSSPRLSMQFYVNYQAERSFEDLSVEEQGKDEIYAKDENGNNYSPAWYTLNFKANYQFERNFNISAGLENITDQRYRPYSSGISGPGRNFVFSLGMTF